VGLIYRKNKKAGIIVERDDKSLESKKFMSFLIPNQRQIHGFILLLVANRTDADDILQDTLAEMWNKFHEYEEGTNFVSWGLTIAKYKVYQFIRKNKSHRLYFDHQILELLQQESASKQGRHTFQETLDVLKECVSKLQSKEKEMLQMRYEQNLTFEGIAAQSGVSVPAIFKALGRIHARLARCIDLTLRLRGAV
jgi:RNA polymerase sigma-70 factor (ECF subfamily)